MSPISQYQEMLTKLKAEVAELLRQRQTIDERLAGLKQAVDGLSVLIQQTSASKSDESGAGIEARSSLGLTDSIRDILGSAGIPLSATEMRDRLVSERRFKPDEYSNFLTIIHNTMRRLVMSHDVGFVQIGGKTFYLNIPHTAPATRSDTRQRTPAEITGPRGHDGRRGKRRSRAAL